MSDDLMQEVDDIIREIVDSENDDTRQALIEKNEEIFGVFPVPAGHVVRVTLTRSSPWWQWCQAHVTGKESRKDYGKEVNQQMPENGETVIHRGPYPEVVHYWLKGAYQLPNTQGWIVSKQRRAGIDNGIVFYHDNHSTNDMVAKIEVLKM